MNDTIFTVKQLENIIPILVDKRLGITTSDYILTLVEFSLDAETTIDYAEQDNEHVYVEFKQSFLMDDTINEWSEYTRYVTIQSILDIQKELNKTN
jgi:hypothetical protein